MKWYYNIDDEILYLMSQNVTYESL